METSILVRQHLYIETPLVYGTRVHGQQYGCWQPVTSFTKEVISRLAKRLLFFNGRLANHRLTSSVKEATGDPLIQGISSHRIDLIFPEYSSHNHRAVNTRCIQDLTSDHVPKLIKENNDDTNHKWIARWMCTTMHQGVFLGIQINWDYDMCK